MKQSHVFRYFAIALAFSGPFAKSQENTQASPETESKYWIDQAQATLRAKLKLTVNTNQARNVIFFMGDGMSIATLAAARPFELELKNERTGENNSLSFEKFPHIGLSKTYCVDMKVADSASTATAYAGGVKANYGTIGVNGKVPRKDCIEMNKPENHVDSIIKWFQDAGKATGIVTTTRVTHASPAGYYAHVAERGWESDKDVMADGKNPQECSDIASQLIFNQPGENLNVIMGGGWKGFTPTEDGGDRKDGKNLMDEWTKKKVELNKTYRKVTSRDELLSTTAETPEYLLGLFAKSHMADHFDLNFDQPRLLEMVEQAIKVLQKNPKGYFLFVEGGKIDLGHHANRAHIALDETVELSLAVAKAASLTNRSDTLIVVTSDHSHTMTYNGYPERAESILGFGGLGTDDIKYTILSYANGPGYRPPVNNNRFNIGDDETHASSYRFHATVPLKKETHGGEDVATFADGPWSHLFTGSYEQNYIPHAVAYAACVGKGETLCKQNRRRYHLKKKRLNLRNGSF